MNDEYTMKDDGGTAGTFSNGLPRFQVGEPSELERLKAQMRALNAWRTEALHLLKPLAERTALITDDYLERARELIASAGKEGR